MVMRLVVAELIIDYAALKWALLLGVIDNRVHMILKAPRLPSFTI
jgi:hypothetical protein